MKHSTLLRTTAAALALTASSVWAQENSGVVLQPQADTTVQTETDNTEAKQSTDTTAEMDAEQNNSDSNQSATATAETDMSSNVAESADENSTSAEFTEQTSITETEDDGEAVKITEENVREATEGDVNVADEGATDFSDQEPIISGDVNDDGTVAVDSEKPTADVAAGTDPEPAGTMQQEPEVALNESADEIPAPIAMDEEFGGLTAGDLLGRRVYGSDGARVGEVDDVVLVNGQLAVIVGIGGFLGFGGREVAVALSELREGGTNEVRLQELTGAQIEARPLIDEDRFQEVQNDLRLDERL